MDHVRDTGFDTSPAEGRTRQSHRLRGLVGIGFVATLAAMAATTLAAALARAAGVDFEIPEGGETVPLPGFAVVTGFFSVVGTVIAAALLGLHLVAAAVMVPTLARSLRTRMG